MIKNCIYVLIILSIFVPCRAELWNGGSRYIQSAKKLNSRQAKWSSKWWTTTPAQTSLCQGDDRGDLGPCVPNSWHYHQSVVRISFTIGQNKCTNQDLEGMTDKSLAHLRIPLMLDLSTTCQDLGLIFSPPPFFPALFSFPFSTWRPLTADHAMQIISHLYSFFSWFHSYTFSEKKVQNWTFLSTSGRHGWYPKGSNFVPLVVPLKHVLST